MNGHDGARGKVLGSVEGPWDKPPQGHALSRFGHLPSEAQGLSA